MASVEVKKFDSPDEVRKFEGNGQVEVVNLGGHTVGRGTFEPGWKWSENVKPIAGTDSCEVSHLAYGHDAEVTGDEPCVMHDFGEVSNYAKPG
jgi:hypothetical protein